MNMMTFRRRGSREGGFSLIEILVVIMILGILMAIAVPTFFGAKRSGWDSKAQATLRSGLAAQRTYYVDYQDYTDVSADLEKIEPNLDWATTDSNSQGVKAAIHPSKQVVVLVSWSQSKTSFCIMNIAQDLTTLTPAVSAVNGRTAAGTYYARLNGVASAPGAVTTGQCGGTYATTDVGW